MDNGAITSTAYHDDDALKTLSHNMAGAADDVDWSYGFNKVNQLTDKIMGGGANLAFYQWEPQYKKNDAYITNGLNQYGSVASTNLSYDASGNLTGDGVWSYVYDIENMLLNAAKPGVSASYLYDPLGRRSAKSVDGQLTTFLHDGVEEIADYDGAGNLLRRYIHGPGVDEYLVMYTGLGTSSKSWFHANHQGSIVAMSDAAGNVTEQHSYDSYGNSADLTGNPFRYTGRRLDEETGLYYYRARYMSPRLGRFLQTDPISYGDGLNWYAYVGNDPVNNNDPMGLCGTRLKGHTAANCTSIRFFTGSGGGGGGGGHKNVTPETLELATDVLGVAPVIGKGAAAAGAITKVTTTRSFLGKIFKLLQKISPKLSNSRFVLASPAFKDAVSQYKNTDLTKAGRALTKHPEVVGLTKANLRSNLRTDASLNTAAETALISMMSNGRVVSRIPIKGQFEGVPVTEFIGANGFGARFRAGNNQFIGFIEP